MPDDLDDNIRAAMKTLDDDVPSGYFDALPNQILARLEDGSMQHGSTSPVRDKRDALTGPPVVAAAPAPAAKAAKTETTEDSGLHDIRNLAQSTKQRLSAKRVTQNPPMSDDVLASSSGSWKNVALPEPARMVSLPDIASLPSKAEILAAEKLEAKRLADETKAKARAKKSDKTAPPPMASDEVLAPVATANAAMDAMSAKPAALPERQAFSLPSQQKRSKAPLFAMLGLGVAAAAGGVIYMQMNKGDDAKTTAAATTPTVETIAQAEAPKAEPAPAPTAPPAAEAAAVAAGDAAGSAVEAVAAAAGSAADGNEADEVVADAKTAGKATKRGAAKGKKVAEKAPPLPETKIEEKKPEAPKPEVKKPGAKDGEGEPSFDALLKEAGVDGEKKEAKPKLDKKSLSADDFKKGMSGIAGKAQGCYKGTQGTAMVKLTVGPTGAVTKVSVSGPFAGSPEAKCVEGAVKSASFPPWDGGPQSFTYSYMLSD
jgi:hypothetical protein